MPQSLTNFDAALKDDYGPGLRNAINNSNVVLTEVSKNSDDIVGRKAVWSVHTGRSASSGTRGELAALPTADRQRFTQVYDDLAYAYHTIKVSGQAKALTKNDTGSFARALDEEIKGAERDLKNQAARQVFNDFVTISGTAYTGRIATLSADPGTGNDFTMATASRSEMRYFFQGMKLDVINASTGAVRSGGPYTVASVNANTKVVTVSEAIDAGVASGDFLAVQGGFGTEINGLRGLISSTAKYANIDPATVAAWAAIEVGSSSTAISEVVLDELAETVETDGNGDVPSLYISDHLQRRKLASQLQAQKRFDGREVTLKAGWKGLQISYGTLVADRYCPTPDLFALTPKEVTRFIGLDWTWDDDDGKILYKALDNSDAVEARFKTYHNLEATTRNAHGHLTLATPTF